MAKKIKVKEAKIETNIAHIGNRRHSIVWILLALIAVVIALYIYVNIEKNPDSLARMEIIPLTFSLLAVIAAGFVYFNIDRAFVDDKRTFLFVLCAVVLRFAAEVAWTIINTSGAEVAYVSIADVFWHLSYIILLVGFGYKISKVYLENKTKIVSGFMGAAAIICALFAWFVWIKSRGLPFEDALAYASLELYVVFDIFVVAMIAIIATPMVLSYNRTFKSYLLIALSFVVFTVYDIIFAETNLTGWFYLGNPLESMWTTGYILMSAGLFLKYLLLKGEVE